MRLTAVPPAAPVADRRHTANITCPPRVRRHGDLDDDGDEGPARQCTVRRLAADARLLHAMSTHVTRHNDICHTQSITATNLGPPWLFERLCRRIVSRLRELQRIGGVKRDQALDLGVWAGKGVAEAAADVSGLHKVLLKQYICTVNCNMRSEPRRREVQQQRPCRLEQMSRHGEDVRVANRHASAPASAAVP